VTTFRADTPQKDIDERRANLHLLHLNSKQLSFQNLNLIEPLLKALNDEGYTIPTPIQEQSIPIILSRKDLLGCAQTGTGKTAAFALPILQLLLEDAQANSTGDAAPADPSRHTGNQRHPVSNHQRQAPSPIRALILTPTRELAIQIDESFGAYGKYAGLKHLVIFGGVPQQSQVQALQRGVDILVATPGRLLDLMQQRYVHLDHIKIFVLDEADRMLDMGFVHDVKKVIAKLPQKKQTLFFSATMPPEIQKLAGSILVNPSRVEVTPVSSTADTIGQSIYFVDKKDKRSLLLHVLKDKAIPTALVFTRTKHGADKVAQGLTRAGIRAEAIHGNKSQNARQRALVSFKNREIRVLVATDIAARGIDIDELTHVINFELPNVPETYVHRIGRTGRAGASGIALSFCDQEEKEFLHDIQKLIGRAIPVSEDNPFAMQGVFRSAAQAPAANRTVKPTLTRKGLHSDAPLQEQDGVNGNVDDRSSDQSGQRRNGSSNNQQRNGRPPRGTQQRGPQRPPQQQRPPVQQQQPAERPPQQPVAERGARPPAPPRKKTNAPAAPMPPAKKPSASLIDPESPDFNVKVNRSSGDERW